MNNMQTSLTNIARFLILQKDILWVLYLMFKKMKKSFNIHIQNVWDAATDDEHKTIDLL